MKTDPEVWGDPKADAPALGLLTLVGLCEAFAKNPTLKSVCSDGNSDVQAVARDLALTVLDYCADLTK